MPLHDITLTIHPAMPVWPGQPAVELERLSRIEVGANSNVSRLALSVHTGTHVDAPVHFLPGGNGVDQLPLDVLSGPAVVIHLPAANAVTAADLDAAGVEPGVQRLLIRTRNSEYWARGEAEFQTGFVGVAADGADWLVARGVALVGVDYLSVAPYKQSRPTHEILLRAGVVVVEGLNLSAITPGRYDLVCLPLKLKDCDGAPARAILVDR